MPGGLLADRYTLIEPLGSGGMGRVWLARDELLGREVAVKELTLPEGDRAEAVTRAVREAQATAQLRHPSIVALHDVVVADDRPWLVMELLRGRTLAEQITAYGPLPPREVARVGADLLEALTVAHGRGLQHRDVKPGNVFLTDGGRVVLTDFGISRQEGQETLTQDGLTIGSPGFIAPERLDGERGGPASDLWSLGATLYVASEGRPPYEGSPSDRVRATLTGQPPLARPPIGPLLAAMMARRPAARPHPDTVLRTLRQFARGEEVPTQPVGRRRKAGVTVGIALAVVAATTAFLVVRKEAAPAPFTLPVDVCSLLGDQQAGELVRTRKAVKGTASSDGDGPICAWTVPGTGVSLQVQKDSDTRDPWSMTADTARVLYANQARSWQEVRDDIRWTWAEIGAKDERKPPNTPARAVAHLGEEAFAFDLTGPDGRVFASFVTYRLANLVVRADYATLDAKPSDEDVRQGALKAARASEQALRSAG